MTVDVNHDWDEFIDLNQSPSGPALIRDKLMPSIRGRLEVQTYANWAALPLAGDFVGQFAHTADFGVFWRWSGTAWRPVDALVASTAERDAAIPSPLVGDQCTLTNGSEYRCLVASAWVLWTQPWTNYTPAVTGTANTDTAQGRYRVSAGFYDVEFQFRVTGALTGTPVVSLPAALKAFWSNSQLGGGCTLVDTSTGDRVPGSLMPSTENPTTVTLAYTVPATGKLAWVAAAAPFTWANPDWVYGRVQGGAL